MHKALRFCLSFGLVVRSVQSVDPYVSLARGDVLPGDPALLFEIFKVEHSKSYETDEEHKLRYSIFLDNFLTVANHNAKPDTERSWEAELNHLADRTWLEFKESNLMDDQNCSATHVPTNRKKQRLPFNGLSDRVNPNANSNASHPLPPWMDWRDYGVISKVKDQGDCGSCWTFATTGCLEAHIALARLAREGNQLKTPVEVFSEQQLLDCSRGFANQGCNGGLPSHAFEYIRYAGGLESEEDYPYMEGGNVSHPIRACTFESSKLRDETLEAKVPYGAFNLTFRDEFELREVIATTGPVTIAFDVQDDFRFYKKGVYRNETCHRDIQSVNHAVLIVGYGIDSETNVPYWLVKNSWGPKWGDEGYFRIERGTNMCGLADCASFPNIYSPALVEDDQSSVNTGADNAKAGLEKDLNMEVEEDMYMPWDPVPPLDDSFLKHGSYLENAGDVLSGVLEVVQ